MAEAAKKSQQTEVGPRALALLRRIQLALDDLANKTHTDPGPDSEDIDE